MDTIFSVLSCTNGKIFLVQVDDYKWDLPKIKAIPSMKIIENIKKLEEVFQGISIDIDPKNHFRKWYDKGGDTMILFYLGIITPKESGTLVSFGKWVPFKEIHKYEVPEKTAEVIADMSKLFQHD